MDQSGGRGKTAWPHDTRRHVMQLVLGCKSGDAPPDVRDIVMEQLNKAGAQIAGPGKTPKEWLPGFLNEWNDLGEVYGANLPKLQELKKRYDPSNRFNKGIDLANGKVGEHTTV